MQIALPCCSQEEEKQVWIILPKSCKLVQVESGVLWIIYCDGRWRELTNSTQTSIDDLKNLKIPQQFGLFPFLCKTPTGSNSGDGADPNSVDFCKKWFEVSVSAQSCAFSSSFD
ncbi:unnamed protein product [Gongylonema pulchrum]|uniref:Tudor domain-containing protein n=1 Tax=Gongylonema pulchrum TaxID=637853 RepID=A0A183CZQ6_9BILA|nr:unnamed protein product [Gongylonema pulchrum]